MHPTIIILAREDINSPLHPRFWEDLCDNLGKTPAHGQPYPEMLDLTVTHVDAS